ncbi:hypothetical protein A3J61_02495 [Candidatus Nomurabacteria bacterium RIFCSPHIGHO2_02_FULL_38_15]|uniref:Uncharacterized protein n=1 Tax=Candidatus Nomurabacteria bacterium RIFCSPHIGHO2_02_FULL_38_15 TaxID=1801752 RepID=A0A1F6VPX8_9BACT|nr:MAG: hypothetical protein A3J61_02495 [Candidatus Nomurabacteria bacterium RIFCSPHIGHO2_02_FULL_38_15]
MKNKNLTILSTIFVGLIIFTVYLYQKDNIFLNNTISKDCKGIGQSSTLAQVNSIESKKNQYVSASKDIFGQSTQGGEQIDYSLNDQLIIKEQIFYGETGKSEASYYLSEGKVFYFIKKNTEYINSIYQDQSGAVKKVELKEFYFNSNQELCYWYFDKVLQTNDQDTKELIDYLLSGL